MHPGVSRSPLHFCINAEAIDVVAVRALTQSTIFPPSWLPVHIPAVRELQHVPAAHAKEFFNEIHFDRVKTCHGARGVRVRTFQSGRANSVEWDVVEDWTWRWMQTVGSPNVQSSDGRHRCSFTTNIELGTSLGAAAPSLDKALRACSQLGRRPTAASPSRSQEC